MHYDEQRQFFEKLARRYDSRFLRARWPRNQRIKARTLAAELGPAIDRGPVLELGCGTAQIGEELLSRYPELRYVGVDLSASMLAVARARLQRFEDRVELVEVPDGKLDLAPHGHAAAFGVDVLHHVDDPVSILRDLAAAVRPGGRIVFLEPNPRFPLTTALGIFQHEERNVLKIGFRNLRAWYEDAGLRDVRVHYGPLYTPPGPELLEPVLGAVDRTFARIPVVRGLAIFYIASGAVA